MRLSSITDQIKNHQRFLRFCCVGLSSTLVDFGTLAYLTSVAGWPPLTANPLAFVLGTANGFYWNRRWTFGEATATSVEKPLAQYLRFVAVNGVGALLDQGALALALYLDVGVAGVGPKWVGKVVAIPLVVAWNYQANARWTFRSRPAKQTDLPPTSCS